LSRRLRRRYIAVKVEGGYVPDAKDLSDAIWTSLLRLFGEYGASKAELSLIDYNPETRRAILRCSHSALEMVKASIVAVTEVGNEKAALHILLVSGTLKALRRRMEGFTERTRRS